MPILLLTGALSACGASHTRLALGLCRGGTTSIHVLMLDIRAKWQSRICRWPLSISIANVLLDHALALRV